MVQKDHERTRENNAQDGLEARQAIAQQFAQAADFEDSSPLLNVLTLNHTIQNIFNYVIKSSFYN